MCGICGFVDLEVGPLPERRERLAAMSASLRHRGPDDQGSYHSEAGAALGANRLSILDLAGGHQPLANEDASAWVVLNGEIYNYPDLRQRLEGRGHMFKTGCDTEAIAHAYDEWGTECVTRLEGMFAFGVWDEKRRRLMLARDRAGKKPLYYVQTPSAFVFASEIKALLLHPDCPVRLDPPALDLFLTLGYVPGPLTIFESIRKLMPGHFAVLDRHQSVRTALYWDLAAPAGAPEAGPAAQRLAELLESSVRARLLADVPLGVLLSGGLDSSVVTALMKRLQPEQLKSFSVRFREPEHDESSFAQLAARRLGTEHYEVTAGACPPDLLRRLVWHCDEPLADPAIVPTYLVSQLASEHVKVVLTGEGADELFAGYFYHPLERQAARLDWLPGWARRYLLAPAGSLANRAAGRQRYHPRTLWSWQLSPLARPLAWTAIFTDDDKQRWLAADSAGAAPRHAGRAARLFEITGRRCTSDPGLARCLYLDARIPLVDGLLMKVDKMSMAASLEARCPYLDHRVMEFALGLPAALKLQNGTNKVVLREVAAGLLPPEIAGREKHGFDVPVARWLKEDLREYFWDAAATQRFRDLGVIERPALNSLWDEMAQGVPGRARQVWSLLTLAAWCDVFDGRRLRL